MITSLRLVNFKNFADETLRVGPFTVIIGANASGKSNIRDAFRFLHGIGRGYTLAEILGGKYGPGGQREWVGIRGAPGEICRWDTDFDIPGSTFTVETALASSEHNEKTYSINIYYDEFDPSGFWVLDEQLRDDSNQVYQAVGSRADLLSFPQEGPDRFYDSISKFRPALSQLSEDVHVPNLLSALGNMRFLEPSPERMREPSFPGASMLGDGGENLPSVLETICADSTRGRNLMSWLQELTPMDVKDFDFPRDPSGRVHLQIVERNGRKVSAYSASDGTLRFLGILAALLAPNEGGFYFFEEIDNGIHPNRLWLLTDFIERQTANGDVQVITTTHSPALLSWMRDETFENTSVIYRDEYWTDSVIRPIADLYNLRELRKTDTLGELHTVGWFETAMKFSEGDSDSDHLDDDEDDWEQGVSE